MHTTTRAARGIVVALVLVLAPSASADLAQPDAVISTAAIDPAHFTNVPIFGPWIDISRIDRVSVSWSALVVDGLLQDVVGITLVARFFTRVSPSPWTVAPWFPRSGAGFTFNASF